VLAGPKKRELNIETGQAPIQIDLAPLSGMLGFGIAGDQLSFDKLMRTEILDDEGVPQLELFGEETSIAYAEENQFAEEDREDEESFKDT
jgi:hypothetical protein